MKELEKYLKYEIIINWDKIKLAQLGDQVSISVKGLETISYLLEDYDNVAVLT